MMFCRSMCILMGKRLAVFLNSFLLLQSVLGLNCKNRLFLRKNVLRVVFFKKNEVKMVTNWSVLLAKTPNNWNFAYGRFFYAFLKCCIFQNFSRFFKFTSTSW